jgi:uncharacterized membrane protein SpoIIM required for sporulation
MQKIMRSKINHSASASVSIYRKHWQRCVEYVLLLMFHGYALRMFMIVESISVLLVPAVIIMGGLGLQIALLRERRRLRHPLDRKRLIVESTESLSGLLFLVLALIVAVRMSISVAIIMQWLSGLLLGYFFGTAVGEYAWRHRVVGRLQEQSLTRYEQNLTRSVIFPYNLKLIALLWSKPHKRRHSSSQFK